MVTTRLQGSPNADAESAVVVAVNTGGTGGSGTVSTMSEPTPTAAHRPQAASARKRLQLDEDKAENTRRKKTTKKGNKKGEKKQGRPSQQQNTDDRDTVQPKIAEVMKKTKAQKDFKLTSNQKKADPIRNRPVAFLLDEKEEGAYGPKLLAHFGNKLNETHMKFFGGKRYLFGTVWQKSSKKGAVMCYEVNWDAHFLGSTSVEVTACLHAVKLAAELTSTARQSRKTTQSSAPAEKIFSTLLLKELIRVDQGEEGVAPDSEDEEENGEEGTEYYQIGAPSTPRKGYRISVGTVTEDDDEEEESMPDATDPKAPDRPFSWTTQGQIREPTGKLPKRESRVKRDKLDSFLSPMQSLLAFLPVRMFQAIAAFSNQYAHQVMKESGRNMISGAKWSNDITLQEIMIFFGILIHMTMRPTPGQTYTYCWDDRDWHPYTMHMPLRRFQQIRAVIHFNEIDKPEDSNDALFKIRPLLNALKLTCAQYLDLGSDLALDEASVSTRSKYGMEVIFFNPKKPTGKFHFRFYLICCASCYAIVRIRMCTKNLSDVADGYEESPAAGPKTTGESSDEEDKEEEKDDESDNNESANEGGGEDVSKTEKQKDAGKIDNIVVDMCRPYYGSGRVVNMDNLYTGPVVAAFLAKKDVYIRGTVRTNRAGFPKAVIIQKLEASKRGRGVIKCMIDKHHKLAAYGWTDGNPVHLLTSADSTSVSEVTRQIGTKKRRVRAPLVAKRYNEGMQAVDRNDQLRQLFSLSGRHGFKKYYVKIALGLFDMALANAWIHFAMVNPEKSKAANSRFKFQKELADEFISTDWVNYLTTSDGRENHAILHELVGGETAAQGPKRAPRDVPIVIEDDNSTVSCGCTPFGIHDLLKKNYNRRTQLACQVCAFEGRGHHTVGNVVVCLQHRIRCCMISRPLPKLFDKKGGLVKDKSWCAPREDMSCWEKAHSYYLPQGLFKVKKGPPMLVADLQKNEKPDFSRLAVGCGLNRQKNVALGYPAVRRGIKRAAENSAGKAKRRGKRSSTPAMATRNNVESDDDSVLRDKEQEEIDENDSLKLHNLLGGMNNDGADDDLEEFQTPENRAAGDDEEEGGHLGAMEAI